MEIAGYIASILIGISLGLIGGGGSILTVPVLVYLFSIDTLVATTYSLFVVGSTSIVGSFTYLKKKLISIKTAIEFGIPSIISIFITRIYLLPLIPDIVKISEQIVISKSTLLLLLFAVLMLVASFKMIRKSSALNQSNLPKNNYITSVIQGLLVGMVTGLVGAGGGFLIIPALVNLLKLPMKSAVGTSLLIIAVNSLTGFFFSLYQITIDWSLLMSVAILAIVGILIGSYLSNKIDGSKLKPAFGWFILIMGLYIMTKEIV